MDNIQHSRLRVSGFDRTQASLISAIFVFGFLFATLFAIWWSLEFHTTRTGLEDLDPVKPLPLTKVSLDQNSLFLIPLPPTAAPQLSNDIDAVDDVVSTLMAKETKSLVDGLEHSDGTREIGPTGPGAEPGNSVKPGTLSGSKRWSMVYQNLDFDEYVKMLDFFDIEIGVVRLKSNEIMRVNNPGDGSQVTQSERATEESSFYFKNTKSTTRRWDAKIVKDVSIDYSDSALVHFYPDQAVGQLRAAELTHALGDGKTVENILSTRFAIVATPNGYEFRVKEIEYR